jgi:TRAP-type C4-dicarboxylate transport system permease small subunit
MKKQLTKILETIAYISVFGFALYILYFGFRIMWIFLESILK